MIFFLFHFGRYILLIKNAFKKPDVWSIYIKELKQELYFVGINSFPLVSIISLFIGIVTTFQTGYQLDSGFIPSYIIGTVTRDSSILELSPTVIGLVLAGKLGSAITSQIGSMRVSEQLDALDIMGINTTSYLILPRLIAAVFMVPVLVIFSIFFSLLGGYISTTFSTFITPTEYIFGILNEFDAYYVLIALVKAAVYAVCIVTISSYQGFYVVGGSREVGKASTRSVTFSCLAILCMDYLVVIIML